MATALAAPIPHNAHMTNQARLRPGPSKKRAAKASTQSAESSAQPSPAQPDAAAAHGRHAPATPPNMVPCLDDLAVRFILNCPAEQARDEMMIFMFEVEKAFWFYLDFWREHDTSLPALNMRDFSKLLFNHCAMLQPYAGRLDAILSEWQSYKKEVPTYGACILNESLTKVLLVRGWKSSSWGWPKGKINHKEDEALCAAREVAEEIGFDISEHLDPDRVLSCKVGDVIMKLYVVTGIPEETRFETQTRKEISEIKWHAIRELGKESGPKMYSVTPVLGRLRGWISDFKRSLSRSRTPERTDGSGEKASNKSSRNSTPTSPATKKGRRAVKEEVDAAGVARDNEQTFGSMNLNSFSVEDMFRVNKEKFGIESTYSFDHYTTKLPGGKEDKSAEAAKCMYAERYRPIAVTDVPDSASECGSVGAEEVKEERKGSSLLGFKLDRSAIMSSMSF